VDSGVRRQLADGNYGRRRAECEAGLAAARDAGIAPPGAQTWRDVEPARLAELERALDPPLFRRARHLLTENARVDATCEALERGDLARVGALLHEGQRSLRDDFEVSRLELDVLCDLGEATPGCYGSRLTGAGFGGCTIHLVEPSRANDVAASITRAFTQRFGRNPPIHLVTAAAGAAPL
ncbi:MAG: galactokinase, partial [Proteobacteria bacterium]|nr:galactokinase [Pseudomonadota bacterium]